MKKKDLNPTPNSSDLQDLGNDVDEISQAITLCAENLMGAYPDVKRRVIIGNLFLNTGLNIYTQTLGIEQTHQTLALAEQSLRDHLESVIGKSLNPPTLH